MTSPTVSVIVPCHNGGRFLDALLASLAAQTFRDFEVVIVNNGSTEAATLLKLASLDPAVRVVHQENRYLPGARNTGFREARAPFVLPLDCDDTLEPTTLAEMVAVLRDAPPAIGFVFTDMRLTGAREGVLPRHFNPFDQLFLNKLPYCILIRKSAWVAANGYDETMRDGSEDWGFSVRLVRTGVGAIRIPKPLFIYHVRLEGMQLSHSARLQGTIWEHIRRTNPDLYRPSALIALWRRTRSVPSAISPLTAIGMMGLAMLLPRSWLNVLFYRLFISSSARRLIAAKFSPH